MGKSMAGAGNRAGKSGQMAAKGVEIRAKIAEFGREYDRMTRDPIFAFHAARASARTKKPSSREDYVRRRMSELGISE